MAVERGLSFDVALDLGALRLRAAAATRARRIAVVGPSGVGKSTLLRVLAGLEPAARGRVELDGVPWLGPGLAVPPHRRRVGWVPQDVRLFPHLTVLDNLCLAGAREGDARELAARFGIDALLARRPRHLSGGEAQRVALARALLTRPCLLLLDEPFAALDRARRADLVRVLADVLGDDGRPTLVLVSHDERDVATLADEVFELSDGRLRSVAVPDPGGSTGPAPRRDAR